MHRITQDKNHRPPQSFSSHLATAGATTFFLHPLRVALNRASLHTSPIATIKDAYGYMFKGAVLNISRGAFSTGLQSKANHTAQQFFQQTPYAKASGLMSASLVGTLVATCIEVPFMRKTAATMAPSLFKFNRPITTYFFLREIGFSGAVLISKDLSPTTHYSILLSAAWLTASCHKLATIEATKDLINHQYTVPDYSKGMKQALKNISNGVYTLPSLRVPINNPASFFQRSTNLLYATCGPNMFLFRFLYLTAFAELLSQFKAAYQSEENNIAKPTKQQ